MDTSSLAGRPYLVTFLYSTCPDVCPLIAEDLRAALDDLGPRRDDVAVVAVSVDPRGDTRASVREFLRRHRLPANFHYGIGSKSTLAPIWKDWYTAPQISDHPGDQLRTPQRSGSSTPAERCAGCSRRARRSPHRTSRTTCARCSPSPDRRGQRLLTDPTAVTWSATTSR